MKKLDTDVKAAIKRHTEYALYATRLEDIIHEHFDCRRQYMRALLKEIESKATEKETVQVLRYEIETIFVIATGRGLDGDHVGKRYNEDEVKQLKANKKD